MPELVHAPVDEETRAEEREERMARLLRLRGVGEQIPRCRASDILSWKPSTTGDLGSDVPAALYAARVIEEIQAGLDVYFGIFAFVRGELRLEHAGRPLTIYDARCLQCGGHLAIGRIMGLGCLQWSLVNGEAYCGWRECGWPYRVYHRPTLPGNKEPSFLSMALPYHPAEVKSREFDGSD